MLSVTDLRFTYSRSKQEIFNGLSVTFESGTLIGLTGPSGCGKSTLLYLLGLVLRPASGEIHLAGRRVDDLPDAKRALLRATNIGFVFQDSALDPARTILDSVIEPCLYAGRSRREAEPHARELLNRLGVEARADHRPGEISGGQAQRVAVARALANDPKVILADEPTGNLDPDNSAIVLDSLRTAADDGACVIIATHDPYVLECCDREVKL